MWWRVQKTKADPIRATVIVPVERVDEVKVGLANTLREWGAVKPIQGHTILDGVRIVMLDDEGKPHFQIPDEGFMGIEWRLELHKHIENVWGLTVLVVQVAQPDG